MDGCLNSLEKDVVFIPIAALLALVLLVWVQLHVHGKVPGSVNWVCGVSWAYLAILFALIAVALFICNPTSTCAKGFLILAFFMTGMNVAFLFGQNIVRLFGDLSEESFGQSLFGECGRSKWWILFWAFLLIGLGFVSFYVVGLLGCCFLWAGMALVSSAVLTAIVVIGCRIWREYIWPKLKDICSKCCPCTCVRSLRAWLREKCCEKKTKEVQGKEKKTEKKGKGKKSKRGK